MSNMTTLKPDESINDHVKDTKDIINHIMELSIGCMRDLANPHEGTFIDMTYNKFMRSLEHIRESIEMLEQERTRSNQLEKELSDKTRLFELAKKFLIQRRDQLSVLEEELRQNLLVKDAQKKVIDEKEKQISDLHHEIWELQDQAEYLKDQVKFWKNLAKVHTPNNPQNFCGNCKHFVTHPNDIGTCNNKWAKPFIVDPDDPSCPHFESNQVDRDKPDHPCCKACNRDDCDDCTLCPF